MCAAAPVLLLLLLVLHHYHLWKKRSGKDPAVWESRIIIPLMGVLTGRICDGAWIPHGLIFLGNMVCLTVSCLTDI